MTDMLKVFRSNFRALYI